MRFRTFFPRFSKHPASLVIFSFAVADLLGGLLLLLPWMHRGKLSILDAFFTSTSAVCVTGLTVVNTAEAFTRWGQSVILLLIQVGGLGVMTFSILIALGLHRTLNLRTRLVIQETFLPYNFGDVRLLIYTIFLYTILAEGITALLLFFVFILRFPFLEALYHAVFHSVSAFCNAGFSTFKDGLVIYNGTFGVPFIIMLAILLGNTGFPVVYEIVERVRKTRKHASLHLRLTFLTHVCLILFGAVVLLVCEWHSAFSGLSWGQRILAAFFHSVSARTAGFNTIDMSHFSEHGLYFLVLLMFVGACPGSTGGGIKTTTLAVLWAVALSRLRGYSHTVIFKKTIPEAQVSKAMTLLVSAVTVAVIFHFLLTFSVPTFPFYQAQGEFLATLFETISALGTVGLSTGLTPHLSSFGKVVIIVAMFCGRVGLLSLLSVLTQFRPPKPYFYAPEEVMVG